MVKIIKGGQILTSDGLNAEVIANENIRKQNEAQRIANDISRDIYKYVTQVEYDNLPDAQKLDGKFIYEITDAEDDYPTEIQNVIDDLVVGYDPRLRGIESQLAEKSAEMDAIVANVTVDSEVILARGSDTTLKNRLDKKDSDFNALNLNGLTHKSESATSFILKEKNIKNVNFATIGKKVQIHGTNRFDIANAIITHDGYASTVITKTATGIEIYYPGGGTSKKASVNYIAEFTGDLWASCVGKTQGYVKDIRFVVFVNGVEQATCCGLGKLKQKVSVVKGDTVILKFYMRLDLAVTNTVTYSDIMISYADLEKFVAYTSTIKNWSMKTLTLPSDSASWTASTPAPEVTGTYLKLTPAFTDMNLPLDSNTLANIIVNGYNLVTYNQTYNGVNGLGVSYLGTLAIYRKESPTKTDYLTWLAANPITITYESTDTVNVTYTNVSGLDRIYAQGEIIEFDEATLIDYYFLADEPKLVNCVNFGDSITGMFGNETDYPSMIEKNSRIKTYNVGFSGSQWTDYPNETNKPFSVNRLVDSVISKDFSTQDAKIGLISVKWFAEHLELLKTIDFKNVQYVTFLAGVNDWYVNATLKSVDDVNTENKQRTNVEDAVKYCISQLQTAYPHLKIIVITPYHAYMQALDSDVNPNTGGKYLYEFTETIKQSAQSKNAMVIDLYRNCGVNQANMYYHTSDGTHPNEPFKMVIAKKLINEIELSHAEKLS